MLTLNLNPAVANTLRPRVFVPSAEWAERHITLPKGSEIRGKCRLDLFPHVREPLECFDSREYESITLQWASRLGKTVFAQICLAKTADTNPHPMALADADEKSVKRVIGRLWKILELVPGLRGRVPPQRLRSADKVQLVDCLIHGAWSGSPSMAADYAALVVCLNEIDKMSSRKSDEADFAALMEERAKGFLWSKILRMSTPTVAGKSRVEAARLAGDNRGRYVPCPHCQKFQTLRTGTKDEPGGVKWQYKSDGHSDPELARKTAYYQCIHCQNEIRDEHRYTMLNEGRWLKEGQAIDSMGRITGEPARLSRHATFGPLGTLHSLLPSVNFGMYAEKFLLTRPNQEARRNFQNSWEGLTWELRRKTSSLSELAERLRDQEAQPRICPRWAVFLTQYIDVGGAADEFYWQVDAWGQHARGGVVDYGFIRGEAELEKHLAQCYFEHADGGPGLRPILTLLDSGSGFHTEAIYSFCRRIAGCAPAKGMGGFAEFLRVTDLSKPEPGRKSSRRRIAAPAGMRLFEVNHERSQKWMQSVVDGDIHRGRPDWFSLPDSIAQGLTETTRGPFVQHLLNEVPGDEYYRNGDRLTTWERSGDNEQRDCARGNRALAEHVTKDGKLWGTLTRQIATNVPRPQQQAGLTTPDGRAFLATDR